MWYCTTLSLCSTMFCGSSSFVGYTICWWWWQWWNSYSFFFFYPRYIQYVQQLLNFISVDFTSMTFELHANTISFVNVCFAKINWQTCSTASPSYGNFDWTNWPKPFYVSHLISFYRALRVCPEIIQRLPSVFAHSWIRVSSPQMHWQMPIVPHLFTLKQSKEWI